MNKIDLGKEVIYWMSNKFLLFAQWIYNTVAVYMHNWPFDFELKSLKWKIFIIYLQNQSTCIYLMNWHILNKFDVQNWRQKSRGRISVWIHFVESQKVRTFFVYIKSVDKQITHSKHRMPMMQVTTGVGLLSSFCDDINAPSILMMLSMTFLSSRSFTCHFWKPIFLMFQVFILCLLQPFKDTNKIFNAFLDTFNIILSYL